MGIDIRKLEIHGYPCQESFMGGNFVDRRTMMGPMIKGCFGELGHSQRWDTNSGDLIFYKAVFELQMTNNRMKHHSDTMTDPASSDDYHGNRRVDIRSTR